MDDKDKEIHDDDSEKVNNDGQDLKIDDDS